MLLGTDIKNIFGVKFSLNVLLKVMRLMGWKDWIFDRTELKYLGWGDGAHQFIAYSGQGIYVEITLYEKENVIWYYRHAKVYMAKAQYFPFNQPITIIQELRTLSKEDLDSA